MKVCLHPNMECIALQQATSMMCRDRASGWLTSLASDVGRSDFSRGFDSMHAAGKDSSKEDFCSRKEESLRVKSLVYQYLLYKRSAHALHLACQTCTVASVLPEAMHVPSGDKASELTEFVCPR
jgi:hypothetical protein